MAELIEELSNMDIESWLAVQFFIFFKFNNMDNYEREW
jgi:hypothetical protein